MSNGGPDKTKIALKLNTLLPLALARLLEDKGIITKEELHSAMTKTLLEVTGKQKAAKSSPSSFDRKRKSQGGISHVWER